MYEEEYHVASARLSEEEYQSIKKIAGGGGVSAALRDAAQQYIVYQETPYDERKVLRFENGGYLVLLAHWNNLFAISNRDMLFVRRLLDLIDEFERR